VQTPDVHRLEETYRQMTDGELLKLAEDLDSLTDQAKEALNAELRRRGLKEALVPCLPVPAEAAGPQTPELRQLKETYGQMTDAEILRLATEMDSLPDQTADVLYAEVCRRELEGAVAGEAAEVPPPFEPEELVPKSTRDTDSLRYAGFWPRLGALLLDGLIMLPLGAFHFWGIARYRLFPVYWVIPGTLLRLFYDVYLVRRFGGTPGKLIMGIRIRKLDGEPVGYREALLRYCPELFLGLLTSVALFPPLFQMTDAQYHALGVNSSCCSPTARDERCTTSSPEPWLLTARRSDRA